MLDSPPCNQQPTQLSVSAFMVAIRFDLDRLKYIGVQYIKRDKISCNLLIFLSYTQIYCVLMITCQQVETRCNNKYICAQLCWLFLEAHYRRLHVSRNGWPCSPYKHLALASVLRCATFMPLVTFETNFRYQWHSRSGARSESLDIATTVPTTDDNIG